MELRAEDIPAYVRLIAPADGLQEITERFEAAVAEGRRRLADIRVAKDADGNLVTALALVHGGDPTAVLVGPRGDARASADLVAEVVARARAVGVTGISTRPDEETLDARYRDALLANGFRDLGTRAEFKTPVSELPSDDGSPLSWRGMDEVGLDTATAVLARAAEGDPFGHDERDDPRGSLERFFSAPRLTGEPRCVQIGYDRDEPVAFLCAQVASDDGWSRISYMGVVPEARGRGLGTWVHRRGFRLMRELGGMLYHGGTAAANTAMLRLFESHGCRESARLREFEWKQGDDGSG